MVVRVVDLEVQMVTSAVAGGTHVTYGLTAGDGVPLVDASSVLHVGVQGTQAVGVLDDDIVAEATGAVALVHDGTGLDGVDGITGATGDVEAVVHVALTAVVLHVAAVPVAVHGGDITSVLAGPYGREGIVLIFLLARDDVDSKAFPSGGCTGIGLDGCIRAIHAGAKPFTVHLRFKVVVAALFIDSEALPALKFGCHSTDRSIGGVGSGAQKLAVIGLNTDPAIGGQFGNGEGFPGGSRTAVGTQGHMGFITFGTEIFAVLNGSKGNGFSCKLGGHIHGIVGQRTTVLLVVGLGCPGEAVAGVGGVE